ncbi:hypothetical protein ACFSUS_25790 [Spirosoma soli]|uniref:Uncharacterized protein n=1 Tax=Spirosoma soli TaxID=1770529 RepID=A0ABW5MAJ2_9BACT
MSPTFPASIPVSATPSLQPEVNLFLPIVQPSDGPTDSTPYWLVDQESLRDEGVLFGLSEASPNEKIAEIKAYFTNQSAPYEQAIDHYNERVAELDRFIAQRNNRIDDLRQRINHLINRQPATDNLIRTLLSLGVSVMLCVGNFYLIDETLRPVFANRWIAVGVFLAGMFNLFGRTSFFYEEGGRLTGRRLLEEAGLPLAAASFILAQAIQKQPFWQAFALFVFVFFLFLLAGKLLLSLLTTLRHDLAIIQENRQSVLDKQQQLPLWQAQAEQLEREIEAVRAQKWPLVAALNRVETELARLNAQGDQLVNLFLSEFELARSLRDRLTEQQRTEVLRNYNVM